MTFISKVEQAGSALYTGLHAARCTAAASGPAAPSRRRVGLASLGLGAMELVTAGGETAPLRIGSPKRNLGFAMQSTYHLLQQARDRT